MPTIEININEFLDLLGKEIREEKLEKEASYLGAHWNKKTNEKWEVEVYPNRPDLLSVEGLARTYKSFFDIETGFKQYDVEKPRTKLYKNDSVQEVRPHIAGAIIRDINLNDKIINGLIQLQEKLHGTEGRRRKKIAIGLHDLENLEPPFTYKGVYPDAVSFKPLNHNEKLTLGEILSEHDKGREYGQIIKDYERYPVITDSNDTVLSFPPIINNNTTEVTKDTRDIFIDVTGTNKEAVNKTLNIVATALSERGGTIEAVSMNEEETPDLTGEKKDLDTEYFNDISGLNLDNQEIIALLEQMGYNAKLEGPEKIVVTIPSYRTDIMHHYDLIEDIVIAYGYDEVEPELPSIDQIAEQKPIEKITNTLRDLMQGMGALETHTYVLSNKEKLYRRMNTSFEETPKMENSLNEEYTAVRTWLLPSLMDVLKQNKHHSYPQMFFEIDETVEISFEGQAVNRRKLCYIESGNEIDYTDVKEKLQALEKALGINIKVKQKEKGCFQEDRSAALLIESEEVGFIGEISKDVKRKWTLEYPTAGFEIDVEKLMKHLN